MNDCKGRATCTAVLARGRKWAEVQRYRVEGAPEHARGSTESYLVMCGHTGSMSSPDDLNY